MNPALAPCITTARANSTRVHRSKILKSQFSETIMKWIALALMGALTSCAATTPPRQTAANVISSPQAPFGSYHTFSFGLADPPKPGYEVTPRSLEVQRRLRAVVLAALQERGYTVEDAGGDFVVKLAAGTGPDVYRGEPMGSERTMATGLARGYIGIDIYDRPSGNEVWQGSAFAEIDPATIDDSLLKMGVDHMLKDFPTKDRSGVATSR
jgi:hypothetical protein